MGVESAGSRVNYRDRPLPRRVVLVANDVGGLGGMERQTSRLVGGLLEAGWSVTVVARTCSLRPHPALRFRRVLGPRRPFAVAYPIFALIGSIQAARCRDALLHTTGAIVANRADVSSVHYCHRAAQAALAAFRTTRASPAYRVNAVVAAKLAWLGESWCYRPQRTNLLCPVSRGVARELETHFPVMATVVRTVPNGVDCSEFRPDPSARAQMRAMLGLPDDVKLALFVGGDWQRKGLEHVVEALAFAPGWHLAVAGEGDRVSVAALAAAVGNDVRLHFLGRVTEMPRVYASADAFVFPTTYEAFPLALLEAAAAGLPLLVTRVSGAEELVCEGVNGWFITRAAADIGERLNELAGNARLAARMGESARASATPFSWETMVRGYLSVYEEMIGQSRGREAGGTS